MSYTFFGLPLHPLVIHLTVVLVPVVALALVVEAVVPRTRRFLRWPTAAGALVVMVAVFVTVQSGEHLASQLPVSDLVTKHADLGGQLQPFTAGLAVAAIALLLFTSTQAQQKNVKIVLVAVCALSVLLSAATVVQVVRIGHSGATAAWNGVADLPVRNG